MKPKVLVTGRLLPEALSYLRQHAEVEGGERPAGLSHQRLKEAIQDKEGLLCLLVDRIDVEVLRAAPRLRMIANCAVGVDNIDLDEARRRGVMVSNTPGILTEATADLTWALILAVAEKDSPGGSIHERGRVPRLGARSLPRKRHRGPAPGHRRPGPDRPRGRPPGRRL